MRLGAHVCFWEGVRADSGDSARLVDEAFRLEVGRNGDTDRDLRGWEGVKPPELGVLAESLLLEDRDDREPADGGGRVAPLI